MVMNTDTMSLKAKVYSYIIYITYISWIDSYIRVSAHERSIFSTVLSITLYKMHDYTILPKYANIFATDILQKIFVSLSTVKSKS